MLSGYNEERRARNKKVENTISLVAAIIVTFFSLILISFIIADQRSCNRSSEDRTMVTPSGWKLYLTSDYEYGICDLPEDVKKQTSFTVPTEVDGFKISVFGRVKKWSDAPESVGNVFMIEIPEEIEIDYLPTAIKVIKLSCSVNDIKGLKNYYDRKFITPVKDAEVEYIDEDSYSDGFEFITAEGCAMIKNYLGHGGKVEIPSEFKGLPVTTVRTKAFENAEIEELSGGENLRDIGIYAFADNKIEKVSFPCLVSIDSYAFMGNPVKYFRIPKTLESLASSAFLECKELEELYVEEGNSNFRISRNCLLNKVNKIVLGVNAENLPEDAEGICAYAFASNGDIENLNIPASIRTVDADAFYGVHHIKNVRLGDGMVSFAASALSGINVINLYIPSSLLALTTEKDKFARVENVYIEDLRNWCKLIRNSKTFNGGYNLYIKGTLTKHLTIDGNIEKIADYAFCGCNLRELDLNNVTEVGKMAFAYSSVETVTADNVTVIGEKAFDSCYSLTYISLKSMEEVDRSKIFANCYNLEKIDLKPMEYKTE